MLEGDQGSELLREMQNKPHADPRVQAISSDIICLLKSVNLIEFAISVFVKYLASKIF